MKNRIIRMGKSANISSKKVDSAPAVVAPTKAKKKGKRDAEEIVEKQVLGRKKQKVRGVVLNKKKVKTKTQKKNAKKQQSRSFEEDSSESDEATKKVEPKKLATKKAESRGESDEYDSEESSDEEDAKAPKKPVVKNGAPAKKYSSSEEDDKVEKEKVVDSEMLEAPLTKKTLQVGPTVLYMGHLDLKVQEPDVIGFFKPAAEVVKVHFGKKGGQLAGYAHVEFATPAEAQGAAFKLNGKLLLNRRVKLEFAKERSEEGEGLLVCVRGFAHDNSYETARINLEKLFFPCRGVASICFEPDTKDRPKGAAFITFSNRVSVNKALRLNGSDVGGGKITVVEVQSIMGDGGCQTRSIFIRGFSADNDFDSIRSSLEEHFGQCGEIARLSIPKDYDTGAPKGFAFMDFNDSATFNKALELSGTYVAGGTITVAEAKPRGDGGSGRGGGRGGFDGGRSGGHGRGGGRFGGRDGAGFSGGRGGRFSGGRDGGRGPFVL